jgi:hypothetical protein
MTDEVSTPPFLWISHMEGFIWVGTYLKQVSTNKIGVVSAVCGPPNDQRFAVKLLLPFALPFTEVQRSKIHSRNLRDIPELVISSETCEFASDDVTLVFVFHYEQLDDKLVTTSYIQGMVNVYLLRYDVSGDDVPQSEFFSFPSQQISFCGVCIASSVWKSLVSIQEELHRLMGRVSERQGIFCVARGVVRGLPLYSWRYIRNVASGIEVISTTRSQSKRIFHSGLELTSKRVKKSCVLIRFETHSDIYCLIHLLGDTAIADVRKRRPKLGTSHALQRDDAINTIVGLPDNQPHVGDDARVFRRRTNADGVDFEYSADDATLHLTVRYRKYQVRRNSDGDLVDCPSEYLARLINRQKVCREVDEQDEDAAATDVNHINVGAEFPLGDLLYRVTEHRILEGVVYAACVYPKRHNPLFGLIRFFTNIDEIKQLVTTYLTGV